MSIHQYCLPALSVPLGGGTRVKQQWIEYEILVRFKEIFLFIYRDDAGNQLSTKSLPGWYSKLGYAFIWLAFVTLYFY